MRTNESKHKIIKSAAVLIFAMIIALGQIFVGGAVAVANAKSLAIASPVGEIQTKVTYMISPTITAANDGFVVVFDNADNILNVHDGESVVGSAEISNVIDMHFSNEILYCLTRTENQSELTAFFINESYSFESVVLTNSNFESAIISGSMCFATKTTDSENTVFYFQSSDGFKQISAEKTSKNAVTLTHDRSIPTSDLTGTTIANSILSVSSIQSITEPTTTFLFVATADGIYKISITTSTPYHVEQIISSPAEKIDAFSVETDISVAYTNSNGLFQRTGSAESVQLSSVYFSDISISDKIFATDTENQKIIQYNLNGGNESIFAENNFSHPEKTDWNTGASIKFVQTENAVPLLEYPFSVTSTKTISAHTDLVVLTESETDFADHYYVLFFNSESKTNELGYVKKSSTTELEINTLSINLLSLVETKVTEYPSEKIDSNNAEISVLSPKQKIVTSTNAANIVVGGIRYYMISTANGLGFVARGKTSLVQAKKENTIKTNASVKKEVMMFEFENGTGEITNLSKNTRVKITGSLNSNTTYTKVTISNNEGETITGYVKTSAIEADGLTSLQVVGIILCAANIVILILIFSFSKKMFKHSKQKISN